MAKVTSPSTWARHARRPLITLNLMALPGLALLSWSALAGSGAVGYVWAYPPFSLALSILVVAIVADVLFALIVLGLRFSPHNSIPRMLAWFIGSAAVIWVVTTLLPEM